MRRFWDTATVGRGDDGLVVLLDGKPMRIPGGSALVLHNERLADAIAALGRDGTRRTALGAAGLERARAFDIGVGAAALDRLRREILG